MKITYDKKLIVHHDHRQTLKGMVQQTKEARKNAKIFEKLHPEVSIRPRGIKRLVLHWMVCVSKFLGFIPSVRWWRAWKKAWLDLEC